jgi:hypothetical protein
MQLLTLDTTLPLFHSVAMVAMDSFERRIDYRLRSNRPDRLQASKSRKNRCTNLCRSLWESSRHCRGEQYSERYRYMKRKSGTQCLKALQPESHVNLVLWLSWSERKLQNRESKSTVSSSCYERRAWKNCEDSKDLKESMGKRSEASTRHSKPQVARLLCNCLPPADAVSQ